MIWLLTFSFWLHLLATIVWIGGLTAFGLAAAPAWQRGTLTNNQWLTLQQKFLPWANGSLILLLVTGFFQMTNDPNYNGFLVLDSVWANAMLLKHVAFAAMVFLTIYEQARLQPALERLALLENRPQAATAEKERLATQTRRLLNLNLICAAAVLFFTAAATAV